MAVVAKTRKDMFVLEYLGNGQNAQRACRTLGFHKGQAGKYMCDSYVLEEIEKGKRRQLAVARVKADNVLAEISNLAYSNQIDYVRLLSDGTPVLDLTNVTRDQMAAVSEIQTVTDAAGVTRTKIKLHDKPRALEMLGRHLKLFTDKVEIDGLDRLAEELKNARQRAESDTK